MRRQHHHGAGAGLEAEALQALVDAAPDGEDEADAPSEDPRLPMEDETEDDAGFETDAADEADPTDEPRGFEIVSKPTEIEPEVPADEEPQETPDETPAVEGREVPHDGKPEEHAADDQ